MRTYTPEQRIAQLQRQKDWYIKNRIQLNISRYKNSKCIKELEEIEKQQINNFKYKKLSYYQILDVLKKDVKSNLNKKVVSDWKDSDWKDFLKLTKL